MPPKRNTLKFTTAMAASVPNDPIMSFAMSSPATFLTTMPPAHHQLAGDVAKVMPMIMSRAVPYRRRRGPLRFAATTPPAVDSFVQGGSSGNIWRCRASIHSNSAQGIPASTLNGQVARFVLQQAFHRGCRNGDTGVSHAAPKRSFENYHPAGWFAPRPRAREARPQAGPGSPGGSRVSISSFWQKKVICLGTT